MISPFFENSQIAVTYPMHVSDKKDYWISEYINTFTDPVNHFIFGNASNTRTFSRVYRTEYSSSEYVIYRFDARNYPMLALAQGTTIRKKYFNKIDSTGDDLYPIIKLIEKGYQFAYVPKAQIIHHTVNNINQFIKKQKWAVDNFLEGRQYGINNRSGFQNSGRKLRLKLWPLYAGSIILPVFISTLGLVSERKKAWIYHPILTYIILSICITEFIRIRIIRVSPEINRNL
jgi:hypothetical protein